MPISKDRDDSGRRKYIDSDNGAERGSRRGAKRITQDNVSSGRLAREGRPLGETEARAVGRPRHPCARTRGMIDHDDEEKRRERKRSNNVNDNNDIQRYTVSRRDTRASCATRTRGRNDRYRALLSRYDLRLLIIQ